VTALSPNPSPARGRGEHVQRLPVIKVQSLAFAGYLPKRRFLKQNKDYGKQVLSNKHGAAFSPRPRAGEGAGERV